MLEDSAPTIQIMLDRVELEEDDFNVLVQTCLISGRCLVDEKLDYLLVLLQHKQAKRYPNLILNLIRTITRSMTLERAKPYFDLINKSTC